MVLLYFSPVFETIMHCLAFSRSCSSQSFQGHVFISASQVIIAAAATLMPSAEKEKAERERKLQAEGLHSIIESLRITSLAPRVTL